MQQIERGIYYEDSFLGVTLGALAFPHGVIAIDAPLRAEDARSWRASLINQRGGSNRLLVNLDAHPDRTLGARAMDSTVVAHMKSAQIFRNRPAIFKGQSVDTGAVWETYPDAVGMRWVAPDITFSERMSLFWGGPEAVLQHRPGPTPGAIWVMVPEAKVVFVGDAILLNQPPFLAHADLNTWLENIRELLTDFADFTVVSGRGGPVSHDVIVAHRKIFEELIERLDKLARSNASASATQDLIPWLASRFKHQPEFTTLYTHRLRHGLHQCFNRRFRFTVATSQTEMEDGQ